MTPAEALAEARSLLSESSDGKWKDATDLYIYMTSAEREAARIIVSKYVTLRSIGIDDKDSPSLSPLIKLDTLNTTTVGATLQEYAVPSDYLETYSADYNYSGGGGQTKKQCNLVTFEEGRSRVNNSLLAPNGENPVWYIRLKKIGFWPQPIGAAAAMYEHYYIHIPAALAGGSTAFTLGAETHMPIVHYMVGKALLKDGEGAEGQGYLRMFYETITNLP